ncbi:MAG: anthranilate synthase component I family protein, partial [Verrucomicrobiota bacterium]
MNPVEKISGSNWEDLEKRVISSQFDQGCDSLHPPGAWVGYITFEGEYEFALFPEPDVLTGDSLLPEELNVPDSEVTGWTSTPSQLEYEAMVKKAQHYIEAGDIYQVNLCRTFQRRAGGFDPWAYFQRLWQITAAPYSAYLESDRRCLLSASPELFLRIDGRQVMTQPIKGTRPRGNDLIGDQQNAHELSTHEKEIAELIMITDLERNDLGQICEYGTVAVPELVHLGTFSHVHHLYSTVTGELKDDLNIIQALGACLPGGSITGAPKKRANEIIQQLEKKQRGPYTGVIGYIGLDGTAQFSIAIRTAVFENDELHFGVGSGITAGSNPAKE